MISRFLICAMLVLVAGGCAEEATYQGQSASEWIKLSRDTDSDTRREAAEALYHLRLDSRAARDRLDEMADSSVPTSTALYALFHAYGMPADEWLEIAKRYYDYELTESMRYERVAAESLDDVRLQLTSALRLRAGQGGPDYIEFLRHIAETDPSERVRMEAKDALDNLSTP